MQSKDIGTHIVYSDGRIFNKKTNRFIGCSHNSDGYVLVCLNGKQSSLHRIVASCFLEKDPLKTIVNHKNGVKTDNSVENLEWCDALHNVRHAFENGLMVRHKGSRNHQSKLTELDVISIKTRIKSGEVLMSIAKDHNVTVQCISLIKKGKNWGHII